MEKLISIIIPTYNMERYLRRCLDSLIVSTENMERLEVIVVNDGSKDSSSQIGHEYESRFPHTFRVVDKENGNYGSCINQGLKEASGKYIKVLDADDTYYNNSFDDFIAYLKEIDVDMVLTQYNVVDENDRVLHHVNFLLPKDRMFSVNEIIFTDSFTMHAITYKTKLLKDMCYCQTEGVSYTDMEWSTIPLTKVGSVRYYPIILYRYLVGREGQTVDPQVRLRTLWMKRKVFDNLLDIFVTNQGNMGDAQDFFYKKLIQVSCSIYKTALKSQDTESLQLTTELDNHIRQKSPQLYEDLNNVVFASFLPIKYIGDWRKNPQKRYSYWHFYSFMEKSANKIYVLKAHKE